MTLSTSEVWTLVHAERQRLIADLAPLSLAEWETPSLCQGWSIHDVLAHLVDTATTGKRAFVWSMVRSRGDFDRANDNGVRRFKRDDPQQTLTAFREAEHLQKTPPAHRATRLVEAIVHGEDIRRPLGISGEYPTVGVHEALAYQLRTPVSFGGGRDIAEGCRLVDAATGDAWGDGPEVTGEAVDLLLAVSGRAIDPELLTGPGALTLVERALHR